MNDAAFAPVWSWLSTVFSRPLDDAGLAASRAAIDAVEALGLPALAPAVQRMRAALAGLPPGVAAVNSLAQAYTLLFSGAGGPQTVPPYESAFTDQHGRLFGEAEERMCHLLAELDLHVADDVHEPADHLAIELAAMAHLAGSCRHPAQRDRLAATLAGWLGAFRDGCAIQDRSGFYAAAATMAVALIELEAAVDPDAAEPEHKEERHESD